MMDIRIQEIIMGIMEIWWIQTNNRIKNNDCLKYIYYSILTYLYSNYIKIINTNPYIFIYILFDWYKTAANQIPNDKLNKLNRTIPDKNRSIKIR
jgi:hypothetical protein